MSRYDPHPDQQTMRLDRPGEMDRVIEARAAIQAESEAIHWRVRLIVIESIMMTALVSGAGLAMHYPVATVFRNALLVGGACFLAGMLLIGFSILAGSLIARIFLRRQQTRNARRFP